MPAAAHQISIPFVAIPSTLAIDPTVSTSAKAVYIALASHADYQTHECWPSIARLASQTGLSDETVSRATMELESCGWISRTVRRAKNGRWNGYHYVVRLEACPPGKPDLKPVSADHGFPGTGESGDERESKPSNEKDNTQAPCVSPLVEEKPEAPPKPTVYLVKRSSSTAIAPSILEAINAQVNAGLQSGTIRNPSAYRRTLMQLAGKGEYVAPGVAPQPSTARHEETRAMLDALTEAQAQADKDREAVLEMLKQFNRRG